MASKGTAEDKISPASTEDLKTSDTFEYESKRKTIELCNLPTEILLKILKEVRQFDLFTNVSHVSRRFYELTNDSSIPIKVFLHKIKKESQLKSLLEQRSQQIYALNMHFCEARMSEILEAKLSLMKNLSEVELFENGHLPSTFITNLFTQCQSSLKSFCYFDYKNPKVSFENVGKCKKLENFQVLISLCEISVLEFHTILTLRHLKRLTVFLSNEISVEEFNASWSAADLPKLTNLTLRKHTLTDWCLETVAKTCPNLETVKFDAAKRHTSWSAMNRFGKSLKKLISASF